MVAFCGLGGLKKYSIGKLVASAILDNISGVGFVVPFSNCETACLVLSIRSASSVVLYLQYSRASFILMGMGEYSPIPLILSVFILHLRKEFRK